MLTSAYLLVKPTLWSRLVPCSTYHIPTHIGTTYTTLTSTSYTWTTATSYTTSTGYTTLTDTDTTWTTQTTEETSRTTQTTQETSRTTETTEETSRVTETTEETSIGTSWTTDTVLTTEPIFTTLEVEQTGTVLVTVPIYTLVTSGTTIIDYETQTQQTTNSVTQTVLTSETALTVLTSYTIIPSNPPPVVPEPESPPPNDAEPVAPPPETTEPAAVPPPADTPLPPPVIISSSSPPPPADTLLPPPVIVSSSSPPPVITPGPAPPVSIECSGPPTNDFFGISWFGYRPVPDAPPLATYYRTIDPTNNLSLTSIFCNTPVFEKYFRTNLYDCAQGCGPFQTLDASCNIVVGPVFTGTVCNGDGYTITQSGPSGNAIDLGTTIVGHDLTVDGECVPITQTVLATPLTYTGPVSEITASDDALRLRARSQTQAALILPSITKEDSIEPFNQASNANVDGVVTKLGGADTLFPPESTAALTESEGTVLPVVTPSADEEPAESPSTDEEPAEAASDSDDSEPPPPSPSDESPPAPAESASVGQGATPTNTPPQATAPPENGSQYAAPAGQQGTTDLGLSNDAPSLTAITCVPLSLVVPSARPANSTTVDEASATASVSTPAQTGNVAVGSFGIPTAYFGALGVWAGMILL